MHPTTMSGANDRDVVLQRVLAVSLTGSPPTTVDGLPVVVLSSLAQELAEEDAGSRPALTGEVLDRVLVNRLIEAPPNQYPQAPFQYLLGCFTRGSAELRALPAQPSEAQQRIRDDLTACRELLVSYAGLILTGSGVVPESPEAAARGSLQLLDSMDAAGKPGATAASPVVPLPSGFLDALAAAQDPDTLGACLENSVKELARRVQGASPLGEYATPLGIIRSLVSNEHLAAALVRLPSWMPNLATHTARALQLPGSCWLGPCFSPSPVPDELIPAQPPVVASCFSGVSAGTRRQGDVLRAIDSLRMTQKHIVGELHAIVKALLGRGTREAMLGWLGGVLEGNGERAKMRSNLAVAASHGFFLNLDAVMLKLCGPFLDPSSDVFWKRVDVRYVTQAKRISFAEDTKLAATQEQEVAWKERLAGSGSASTSSSGASAPEFHFVCEAFFMALKALHLGVAKVVGDMQEEARHLQHYMAGQQELEGMLTSMAGSPQEALVRHRLRQLQAAVDNLQGARLAIDTVLGDPEFAGEVTSLYRLLAAWLLRLVSPSGLPTLPLPAEVPMEWATLPEWFLEDMAEWLLLLTRTHPNLLQGQRLDELMLFFVVFIGSPAYVRSPYLRSKLTEVMHAWLPQQQDAPGGFGRRSRGGLDSNLSYLFEAHPLILAELVPALLGLYADVEHTDRANQFYVKFQMRQYIGDLLAHCWALPAHREAWKRFAAAEGGRGPYLRFANMLINDAIYLLDESLKKLKEMRELEQQMADTAAFAALPPQEQQERQQALQQTGDHLRSLLYLAGGTITTLATSTQEVAAPFLLPEMVERLAAMLNYFLLYLTGPERKNLKVKDPDKYSFKPKELLSQICSVYLNMARADRSGTWPRAIAADKRSYRAEMFSEAGHVARQFGLMGEGELQLLDMLADQVAQAAAEEEEEEELLGGDVPDEFLDPVMCTLMRDPVTLPTSNTVMDRPVIMRHLLSDPRDPNSRQPLTPDMLVPNTELRQRIKDWVREQRSKRRSGAAAAANT